MLFEISNPARAARSQGIGRGFGALADAGELTALFPGGELVVQPGGSRFPWLDDPDWYVRTIVAFLSR